MSNGPRTRFLGSFHCFIRWGTQQESTAPFKPGPTLVLVLFSRSETEFYTSISQALVTYWKVCWEWWQRRAWGMGTRGSGQHKRETKARPWWGPTWGGGRAPQTASASFVSILLYHKPRGLREVKTLQPELNTKGFWELKVDSEFASFPTPSVHWAPRCTRLTRVPRSARSTAGDENATAQHRAAQHRAAPQAIPF